MTSLDISKSVHAHLDSLDLDRETRLNSLVEALAVELTSLTSDSHDPEKIREAYYTICCTVVVMARRIQTDAPPLDAPSRN